jgi:hypothetical protein
MKPIETVYKGYRFRSRLEARWACFFDAMGFGWTYEPEGFVLADGTRYLPDFLIDDKLYAEVKPGKLNVDERRKLDLFGKEKPIVLLDGLPQEVAYELNMPNYNCGIFLFYHKGERGNWEYAYDLRDRNGERLVFETPETRRACKAAKSARFEYGEHGARND